VLSGEQHRERVVTPADEQKYLAAASSLLADMCTVLVDSGMRPEELFRQRWENVTWVNGGYGVILVTHGEVMFSLGEGTHSRVCSGWCRLS
jgi:integrase